MENEISHSETISRLLELSRNEDSLFELSDEVRRALAESVPSEATEVLARTVLDMSTRLQNLVRERDEASQRALTDSLTGLPNKAAFCAALGLETRQVQRYTDRVSALAYLDLNGFKAVNDQCGHDAGDRVLQKVATLLKNAVRESDMVARLGGDEFAVLFFGESELDADIVEKLLKDAFEGFNVEIAGNVYPIGASIGISRIDSERTLMSEDDPEFFLREADSRMYEDKRKLKAAASQGFMIPQL